MTQSPAMYAVPHSRTFSSSSGVDAAEQITIYDEGATNGSTAAYVQGATQLGTTINASSYGGGGVTNVTYDVLFTFHACDRVALRWQQNVVTTASIGYGRWAIINYLIHFSNQILISVQYCTGWEGRRIQGDRLADDRSAEQEGDECDHIRGLVELLSCSRISFGR